LQRGWFGIPYTPPRSTGWKPYSGSFRFVIRGFHSDNGSEFINYNVAVAAASDPLLASPVSGHLPRLRPRPP